MPLPSDEEIEAFKDSVLQRTYCFTNRALIREALQGSSLFNPGGNKVLALASDATLRQILVDQGRDRNKSPIQNAITKVASNNNLNDQGITLGLDPFIMKNPGQWGLVARRNVMATTIEAIIGAVHYDSKMKCNDGERVVATLGLS
ncbi:hypothetical protein N7537_011166 [Penicillium hordei]|uniref:RNase III domain-containing protein n=1 Tax=Penicillium hordei TaxID=40994 RepID=A0AAD6DLA8_9EURO|nr:uncharacterized protein N7537_011166 [Penicillium hordei]KAJ5588488.1 hypothetical protein N7537_011166 [Penicillium hordei]